MLLRVFMFEHIEKAVGSLVHMYAEECEQWRAVMCSELLQAANKNMLQSRRVAVNGMCSWKKRASALAFWSEALSSWGHVRQKAAGRYKHLRYSFLEEDTMKNKQECLTCLSAWQAAAERSRARPSLYEDWGRLWFGSWQPQKCETASSLRLWHLQVKPSVLECRAYSSSYAMQALCVCGLSLHPIQNFVEYFETLDHFHPLAS